MEQEIKLKSGMLPKEYKALKAFLQKQGWGTPVDTNAQLFLPTLEELAQLGRNMCCRARTHYLSTRPLYFIPLAHHEQNAYAIWLQNADFIAITTPLIEQIKTFSAYAAKYGVNRALPNSTPTSQRSSFSALHDYVVSNKVTTIDAVSGLLIQGAYAFLIGHEVGHLASGHPGVFNEYAAASQRSSINETVAASGESYADTAQKQVIFNSMEVDADIQGVKFLLSHWDHVLGNTTRSECNSSEEERFTAQIFRTLLNPPQTRMFISVASITIAIALLGFGKFNEKQLMQKTHPLSAMRVLLAMRAITDLCQSDEQDKSGAIKNELIADECKEALFFIHAAMGQMLLQAHSLGEKTDFAKSIAQTPPENRLKFMLDQTGMFAAIGSIESISNHIQVLSNTFNSTAALRVPHQRWASKDLLRWTATI